MELLGQQQCPRVVELWKKLQTPSIPGWEGLWVDHLGSTCEMHPQRWRQLPKNLGTPVAGSRVSHFSHQPLLEPG